MAESIHEKLKRVRKPRVHITYEVETEGAEILRELPFPTELIYVNDGSRDRTQEIIRGYLQAFDNVALIDLSRNFGKEAAMTAGIDLADGDAVAIIDADLQDPPAQIKDFLAKWREGYDVVYGVRASREADSFFKRATAGAFYRVFNAIASVPIPHDAGDFRLMDRRVVDALLALPERNRFMKGLFAWVGFKQTGVEFVREARVAGKTSWNFLRLWNFAVDGLTSLR